MLVGPLEDISEVVSPTMVALKLLYSLIIAQIKIFVKIGNLGDWVFAVIARLG